jgi:hypothetical protein
MHIMADGAALIRPTNASNHNLNPIGISKYDRGLYRK